MNGSKPSYAWWIVFAGFILMASSVGIVVNCTGLFLKPVTDDLGFGRADFSLYFTISTLMNMLAAPFIAKFLTKYNPRMLMAISGLIAGLAYMGFSKCSTLGQFYALAAILGVGVAGISLIPVSIMLTNWFVEKRGLAMGLAFTGSGIGGMVFNPITNWFIINHGWQSAYLFLGSVILLTVIPTILLIVYIDPASKNLQPYGSDDHSMENSTASVEGMTLQEAVKSSSFWFFGLGIFLIGLVNMGVQQHIPAYLTDLGYSATFAANLFALYMAFLVGGKLILGAVFDRYGPTIAMIYGCFAFFVAAGVFLGAGSLPMVYLFALIMGLGGAIATVPGPYITSILFGQKNYGIIIGVVNIFLVLGMAIGMPLSGVIYDRLQSYNPAWMLYMGIALLIMLFMTVALRKSRKEQSTSS